MLGTDDYGGYTGQWSDPSAGIGLSTTPTENGITLDRFNDALRASSFWQNFMSRAGYGQPGALMGNIRLTDDQRRQMQRDLEALGMTFEDGMEIDPAGNVNQDQGFSRYWGNPWIRWTAIGAGVIVTLGLAAGVGPLAGLQLGGGAAAGTTAAVGTAGAVTATGAAAAGGAAATTIGGIIAAGSTAAAAVVRATQNPDGLPDLATGGPAGPLDGPVMMAGLGSASPLMLLALAAVVILVVARK